MHPLYYFYAVLGLVVMPLAIVALYFTLNEKRGSKVADSTQIAAE